MPLLTELGLVIAIFLQRCRPAGAAAIRIGSPNAFHFVEAFTFWFFVQIMKRER